MMKENSRTPLVIGLAIPVAMVMAVAVSLVVPGLFAPAPQWDFLYVVGDDWSQHEYDVQHGNLIRREVKYPEHYQPRDKRLVVHRVATNESTEVSFEEAQALALDARTRSPDGYVVAYGTYGSSGFFPFFFYDGTNYATLYLKGHHTAKRLGVQTCQGGVCYGRPRFLGWIIRR